MIETHDQKMEGVEIPVDTSFENNTELPESQPEAANLNLNQFERMIDGCYSKIWSSMQSYIEQTSQRYLEGAKSIVGPGSSTLSSIQASVNEVDSHVHQVDRRFEEIEQKLAFMPNANEFAGLQENLAHVNDKLKKEQQEHSKLVAKFNKYECSLARVTNERDEARQELEKIRNATRSNALTTSSKVTDSAIIEAWKQLQYNIRSLAGSLAKDYPGTRFDHKFEERMRLVCSKYKSHFHHEDYRELLLRAYLWDIIVNDIFNGEANLWARQAGFHLKILKSNMFGESSYLIYTKNSTC